MKHLQEAIVSRRTYYQLSDRSPISDNAIKGLVDLAVKNVPSAFNSQSARLVLLLNDQHKKLWDIVKQELEKIVHKEQFVQTKAKIENAFQAGYGTVLFYEDTSVIQKMQAQFMQYKDNFPVWSEQSAGMHQYAVWMLLEEAGFGASLQHYNPLIDAAVANAWNIRPAWKLVAQMPFGVPVGEPGDKSFEPLENRSLLFS